MEHIIDNTPAAIESSAASENSNNKSQSNQIITREERETSLFNNYRRAFSKTLENLNVNKSENNRDNNTDNLSMIEDDNFSVASSKILSIGNKNYKNTKLPMIYGSKEFIASKYLGLLVDETNQSAVNNSAVENQNLNNNNNNNLASQDNLNSRSQSNIYNNANNLASENPINAAQNQNNLNAYENYNAFNNQNNYRNYEQNYDYNNSRPSMVSELARPNFQQIMDQEISLNLNKKTSMEFNLLNNNNTVNFMRNQSLLIPSNIPNNSTTINIPQTSANLTNTVMKIRPVNIKGKAPPKAPPLPPHIQQALRKIPKPEIPSQGVINDQNITVKLSQNFNSNVLRNPGQAENRNANNIPLKYDQSDPLIIQAQENNRNPLSFKDSLSMKIGGQGGRPLIMPPRNSGMDTNSYDRGNDYNQNNSNKNGDFSSNYLTGVAQGNNESHSLRNNEMSNPSVNNNPINKRSQSITNSTFAKQKNVTLGNFVKKSNLFEVEEDDEEDNTGLFRRGTSNNINLMLNKRNTQNNFDLPEELTSNTVEEKNNNFNSSYNSNNANNSFNNISDQNNESKKSLFLDEINDKIQNKQPIKSQRSILKTKGLEKAKSNLNSMFGEEKEDKVNFVEDETPVSINKKTVDITKRLSNIFNLDEENDTPVVVTDSPMSIQEQINKAPIENNKPDKIKFKETRTESNINTMIQPMDKKIKETKNLNDNNLNKVITKAPEPYREEKSNIKPDLNKLNKLFLAEEEDELDFKNINFKKEEKKILNPQTKEVPKSSDIVKNIENLTNQRNEKFKEEEENEKGRIKKNFIIDDEDNLVEIKTSIVEKPLIKEANKNNINNGTNNNTSTINYHDSSNKTNTSSENQSKNKICNVDPLTGEPLPIKKEPGVKKNSIKTISDPLSMIKASVHKKNKNDPLSSIPSKINLDGDKKEETQNKPEKLNNNIENNKEISKKEKEDILITEKKEEEIKPAGKVSDLSKMMSARMIFPGFPPPKKNEDNEFRPETSMNIGKDTNSRLNSIQNTRKNSNLSEEEDDKLNKIILDRPIVRNKKKQKLKKMKLEDPATKESNEKPADDNLTVINQSKKVENNPQIEKITEENETEKSTVVEKDSIAQITEIKENKINVEPILPKPQEEIKKNDEPILDPPSQNFTNNSDLLSKMEDLFDPLITFSKQSNNSITAKNEINNPTPKNKPKKFNLFDEEDDKPKIDKTEELFKLPAKRNTKIISFLDENEADDPLTALKKNKTIATKEEKPIKKKGMSDKLKFLLDD